MTPANPVVGRPGGIFVSVDTAGAPPCARSSAATDPAKSTVSPNSGRASGTPGPFFGGFAKGGSVDGHAAKCDAREGYCRVTRSFVGCWVETCCQLGTRRKSPVILSCRNPGTVDGTAITADGPRSRYQARPALRKAGEG